eukprot:m.144424 g.144424  ORF g.144424 m.144424 type:complete len:319 (-) comp17193_c0_seq3:117-1073(-)
MVCPGKEVSGVRDVTLRDVWVGECLSTGLFRETQSAVLSTPASGTQPTSGHPPQPHPLQFSPPANMAEEEHGSALYQALAPACQSVAERGDEGWKAVYSEPDVPSKDAFRRQLESEGAAQSLLSTSCMKGNLDVTKFLVQEEHVRITDTNSHGSTPLHVSCCYGQLEIVRWLLATGSVATERNDDGMTALLLSAFNGYLELVQWLLAEGGSSVDEEDNYGGTALLMAAFSGHLELVQWLLESGGASNNERERTNGFTALLCAASQGHIDVVKWLLLQGPAMIDEQTPNGRNALQLAQSGRHDAAARWLKAYMNEPPPK